MASVRYGLGVTKRQAERVKNAFRQPQWLYVVPYNAPWYELLLSGGLMIKTESGEFGAKTGSNPKKHRGWVGFYNSKARVRMKVVERHGINADNLNLGMLVGMGYLEDSRELTPAEQYQWYLRANKTDDSTVIKEANYYFKTSGYRVDSNSIEKKLDWLDEMLHSFAGHPLVIAGPMPIGHFYRPDSLKRFPKPIPIKYPSGPVTGTKLVITPDILRAIREVGINLS